MTYEKKSCGNILMGNGIPCKFDGVGSIQIIMHDVVRTLTEVCHIPELKKNLVYVSGMDSKGFLAGLKVDLCILEGMKVCGNVRNQTRKFVHPSRVYCDKLCLYYLIILNPFIQWFV